MLMMLATTYRDRSCWKNRGPIIHLLPGFRPGVKPRLFKLLAHGAGERSVAQHAAPSHLHQSAGEEEIRRDTDDQHGCDEDQGQVAKCNQLLSVMEDPVGYGASQSNTHTEGESELSSQ